MTIKRTTDGIADYCLSQVESIDDRDDLDVEKKAKLGLAYLKEAREATKMNLAYKQLMMKAPDVAKNAGIVLHLGSPKVREVESKPEVEATAN